MPIIALESKIPIDKCSKICKDDLLLNTRFALSEGIRSGIHPEKYPPSFAPPSRPIKPKSNPNQTKSDLIQPNPTKSNQKTKSRFRPFRSPLKHIAAR